MATRPVIEAGDCTVSGSNTEQASWAVSYPNASAGDLLIFNVGWDDSTTTTSCSAPAGPNGETAVSIEGPTASASTEVRGQSWYYVATGTWTANTLTFTPSATESWSATVVRVPAGEFDAVTPIGANASTASTGTAETTVLSPAFTAGATDGDGCLVWFGYVDADPLSATNPTGWTIRQRQDLGAVAHGIATRDAAVTNSESITAGSWSIAGDSWASIAYVVRPPPALYYVVYPSAESEPSATQIKAGQKQSGAAATASGSETARTTTGEEVFAAAATGLTGGTSYKTSYAWSDGTNNSNVSTTAAWATVNTGALAATESGSDAAAVAGAVRVSGSVAATESGADVAALAGAVRVAGSLAASETGADTAAIVGAVRIVGALDASESGSDVASLSGGVVVSGALAVTEAGADTAAIAGSVLVSGALDAGESGSDVADLSGVAIVAGALAADESGADTAAIEGTAVSASVTGYLDATESGDTAEIAGSVLVSGALAATEFDDTAAIVGTTVAATVAVNLHPLNRARSRYAVRLGGEMVFVDSPQALQAAIDDFEQQTQERARRKGEAVAKTAPRTTPKAAARAAPRVSVVEAPEVDREALAAQMATTNARIRAAYENATRAALIARYLEIEMQVQDDEAAIMALEA